MGRAYYKDGRALQKKLVQRKSADAVDAEHNARNAVYRWAEKTWKVLKQHFPGHEQDFLPRGMILADEKPDTFNLYCEFEILRLGDLASKFLESKLEFVGNLLKEKQQ